MLATPPSLLTAALPAMQPGAMQAGATPALAAPGAEAEAGFGALFQRAVAGLGAGSAGLPVMAAAGFGALPIALTGAVPLEAMVAMLGQPPEVTVPMPTLLSLRDGGQEMLPADDVPLPDIEPGGVTEALQPAPAMPPVSLLAAPPPAVPGNAPAGQGTAEQSPEPIGRSACAQPSSEKPAAATPQQAVPPPALPGAASDAASIPQAASLVDAHPIQLSPAPPTAGQAAPVYLALPPGIVPRLVSAKASLQLAADIPQAMADRARPSLASPGVGPPADTAIAEAAPAAWIDPAPRALALPAIATNVAKSQASQPAEGLSPASAASLEAAAPLSTTAPAFAAPLASEPVHIAPPSPTRQLLPITIAMLISAGTTPTLTVTLEPGEMGQVEIRVGRDADGTTLRLIAERPETAALMQRDGRELQQGLAQSGIRLAADAISFETAGGGSGQPGDRPPPRDRGPGRAGPGPATMADPSGPLSLLDLRI